MNPYDSGVCSVYYPCGQTVTSCKLPVGCALSIVRNRTIEEALEIQSAVSSAAVGIAANS